MEKVDVTQMTREELEKAVINQKDQLIHLQLRLKQRDNHIAVLSGQVEFLGDKLLQIRELTK